MLNVFIYTSITMVTILLLILVFPFRFHIKIQDYTFQLYLYRLKILEHNLLSDVTKAKDSVMTTLLNNTINTDLIKGILSEYSAPFKVLYKIKIRYVKVLYYGFSMENAVSPLMYGVSNALVTSIGGYLQSQDIPLYYRFAFSKKKKFYFHSMVYFTLGTLFEELWHLRRSHS